jgi:hypothetical protein
MQMSTSASLSYMDFLTITRIVFLQIIAIHFLIKILVFLQMINWSILTIITGLISEVSEFMSLFVRYIT